MFWHERHLQCSPWLPSSPMGFASKEEIASLPKLALTPRRYRPLESRRHLSLGWAQNDYAYQQDKWPSAASLSIHSWQSLGRTLSHWVLRFGPCPARLYLHGMDTLDEIYSRSIPVWFPMRIRRHALLAVLLKSVWQPSRSAR